MSPRPRFAYLTLHNDRFELVVSDHEFQPAGNRLLRGDSWPMSVNRLYNPNTQQSLETVKQALEDANAFLSGQTITAATPKFGETIKPKRRRP